MLRLAKQPSRLSTNDSFRCIHLSPPNQPSRAAISGTNNRIDFKQLNTARTTPKTMKAPTGQSEEASDLNKHAPRRTLSTGSAVQS